MKTRLTILVVAILAGCLGGAPGFAAAPNSIDYQRQIAPLLAEHCYQCHGPNAAQRKGGLRLDALTAASAPLPSGSVAIQPGQPAQSELLLRVASPDAEQRMPPPAHGRGLTTDEIALLRQWIAEGAVWNEHWSFRQPIKAELPSVQDARWGANPIDRFIAAEIEMQGCLPAAAAPRSMLARRAALTLTGLPPTIDELQQFLADESPDAYERYLDRLFASPRYGEHMATAWLDLARYADTHGFHTDSHRDMWRWRDWVIDAYNSQMPVDRFITEQMAGDLLPQPTLDQQIATGFHRNHMINFENGALEEEYRNLYVVDRVNTTATVFLGLTVACAQCHDHKYDPVSQQEYYGLYAILNNVPELGLDGMTGNAVPFVKAPTREQQRELGELDRQIDDARSMIDNRTAQAAELTAAWERGQQADFAPAAAAPGGLAWHFSFDDRGPADAIALDSVSEKRYGKAFGNPLYLPAAKIRGGLLLAPGAGIAIQPAVSLTPSTGMTLSVWLYPTTNDPMVAVTLRDTHEWELGLDKGRPFALVNRHDGTRNTLLARQMLPRNRWSHLVFIYAGDEAATGTLYLNGAQLETTLEEHARKVEAAEDLEELIQLTVSTSAGDSPWRGMLDELRGYNRPLSGEEVAELLGLNPIREILKTPAELRTAPQQQRLQQYYLAQFDRPFQQAQAALRKASDRREAVLRAAPTSMVMQELPEPRETHVLVRGDYRRPGVVVEPGTPAVLPAWPADAPRNRLGLARWLTDPANPLTARVIVNRQWMLVFGQPLVSTPEDFGLRGAPPTHPELLDWLAVELIESGWDLQHLQRLMLTSAAFRQTSHATAEQFAADPTNRWYARYGRPLLTAEQVRDSALSAAGLLQSDIGGRSVFPYQPAGLWEAISYDPREYSAQTYTQSHGADLYRRSLYTFWKRSLPAPALAAFGAPTRETCTVMRSAAITPQQALVIWNDPTYVEAARATAERMLTQSREATVRSRSERLFEVMLSRKPTDGETAILEDLIAEQWKHFQSNTNAMNELVAVGESKAQEGIGSHELAAWTILAQTIMMTDEYLSRL